MGYKKTIIKYVIVIFFLLIMSNPIISTTKYDQKVAWITGLIFGFILIFLIFMHFKDKLGGDDNARGLQYS